MSDVKISTTICKLQPSKDIYDKSGRCFCQIKRDLRRIKKEILRLAILSQPGAVSFIDFRAIRYRYRKRSLFLFMISRSRPFHNAIKVRATCAEANSGVRLWDTC